MTVLDMNGDSEPEVEKQKRVSLSGSLDERFFGFVERNCHIFPVLGAISALILCFGPYAWSVQLGYVEPFFPLMSDTGALYPIAGFFTTMFHITTYLYLLTGHYRYIQFKHYLQHRVLSTKYYRKKDWRLALIRFANINFWSLIWLWIASAGFIIVGNFRQTEHWIIHIVGIFIFMCGMFFYTLGHFRLICFLSRKDVQLETRPTSMSCTFVSSILFAFLFAFFTWVSLWSEEAYNSTLNHEWRRKWGADKPGYLAHAVAALFEWLSFYCILPMSACLWNRMKKFNSVKE